MRQEWAMLGGSRVWCGKPGLASLLRGVTWLRLWASV